MQDSKISGVVVTGPPGSGRRSAVESAMDLLPSAPRLVKLNGSNFGTRTALGALSFLLAQLDLEPDTSRHEVMRALGELLCPDGQASVVMLGRPELVDGQSSSLLAQLASIGKIKLAVICDQVHRLPGDLLAVYRSGMLKEVAVTRMDSGQMRRFLELELQGQVSAYLASTLCHLTAGNRGITRTVLRSWRATGQVVEAKGVWILRLSDAGSGPEMQSMLNSTISGLDDAERELLAALCLGGPAALERIHHAGLSLRLDRLSERGLVRHLQEPAHCVGLGIPVFSLLLCADSAADTAPADPGVLQLLHADAAAARTRAGLQRAYDIGSFQAMAETGESFARDGYSPEGWCRDAATRAGILRLHAKALGILGRPQEALRVIGQAQRGLSEARTGDPRSEQLLLASQQLEILHAFIALACAGTDGGAAPAGRGGLQAETTLWLDEPLRLRALAIQAASWSGESRQDDALRLVRRIDSELHALRVNGTLDQVFSRDDVAEIEYLLLQSELIAAQWDAAAARAEQLATGHGADTVTMAHAEMVRGLMMALCDRHEEALRILLPCLEQLRQLGSAATHWAVQGAVCYSQLSLARPADISAVQVPQPEYRPGTALDFNAWLAALFSSLCLSMIGETGQARARLAGFAGLARAQDHPVLESLALAYALRLGSRDAAGQLERASLRCHGALGRNLLRLARAAGHEDAEAIGQALQDLARNGRVLLATSARNELVSRLSVKDQRQLAKTVSTLKRVEPAGQRSPGAQPPAAEQQAPLWARELTKREVQIALWAIGGKSNQEIAKYNGVSIRTVEGHLYQVYAKLQVRNRQELTALDRASRRAVAQR